MPAWRPPGSAPGGPRDAPRKPSARSHFTKPYVRLIISRMTILRNRNLAAIVVAELVSLTGSAMTFVALPWFVLITTGSTAKMGWVLAAELVPVGLLGIPSGTLIARLGAKRTMNLADAVR